MIRNEDGLLTGYVFVDVAGRDISSYVDERARRTRADKAAAWLRGALERPVRSIARVRARPAYIIPLTSCWCFWYLNTRSLVKTAIVTGRTVLGRRRHLVSVPARLRHERCRGSG